MNEITNGNKQNRTRVIAALNHSVPDRVPLTLGSPSCSLHKRSHSRLLTHLGISKPDNPKITDNILQIVETDPALLDMFDIDLRWLLPRTAQVHWEADRTTFTDNLGRKFKVGGGFFNQIHFPIGNCSKEKLEQYQFPEIEKERFAHLGPQANKLSKTGYAIGIDGPWGLYEICTSLMGTSELLMDLLLDPILVSKLAERVLFEYLIPFYDLLLEDTKDLIQMVGISDDLGSQTNLLFAPKIYREIFKPFHKLLIEHIQSKTNAKIYMHSDGSIIQIIPDLIEIGVDGLNPVQYTAKNMQLEMLVNEFGKDLGFFGGVIENEALSFSPPETVRSLVKQNMAILKKHHAFIFAPIHNISQEVPPENIIALYQAGIEFGAF